MPLFAVKSVPEAAVPPEVAKLMLSVPADDVRVTVKVWFPLFSLLVTSLIENSISVPCTTTRSTTSRSPEELVWQRTRNARVVATGMLKVKS